MSAQAFTADQVNRAIDHLIRHGAENRGALVVYSLVFEAADMPAPQHLAQSVVSQFMEALHHRCVERDLPPLDALVVNAAGDRAGMPGAGYFRVNAQPDVMAASADEAVVGAAFWQEQRDRCTTWGRQHRRERSKP